jgi:predicted nucleic acid-binding protein
VRASEALRGVTRLGVDTSALVDLVNSTSRSALAWARVLPLVEGGELVLVASHLMIAEALVICHGLRSDMATLEALLVKVETVATTLESARLAAEIGIAYRVATPDALHLATAILSGCEAFLTVDSGFSRVRGYPLPGAPERVFKILNTMELEP